jgi:inner membrane protein
MPSTVVHLAFAGMIAAALLGHAFGPRALLVVVAVTAFPDLDSFVALVSTAGHRTVLHNFFVPALLGGWIWFDTRIRTRSWLQTRWGQRGVRIAWVSVVCLVLAGIGLDLFSAGGANPLWPLHDQLYVIDGKVELSSQRGVVQTFLDLSDGGVPEPKALGNSKEVTITTGVDPAPTDGEEPVDHIFPVVRAGWQLLLLIVGTGITAARFYVPADPGRAE